MHIRLVRLDLSTRRYEDAIQSNSCPANSAFATGYRREAAHSSAPRTGTCRARKQAHAPLIYLRGSLQAWSIHITQHLLLCCALYLSSHRAWPGQRCSAICARRRCSMYDTYDTKPSPLSQVLAILRQCRTSRATADTNAAANQHNSSLAEHEIQQIDLSQQLEWIYESLPHPDAQHLLHNLPEPVSRTSKSSAASSSDSTAAEPAAPDPYSTIAPANDPLQHLRGFLISKQQDTATSGPYTTFPLPSASVATLQQLQQFYCDCVIRLSAHVGFLESTADAAAANATATATLVKYHAQGLITLVTRSAHCFIPPCYGKASRMHDVCGLGPHCVPA